MLKALVLGALQVSTSSTIHCADQYSDVLADQMKVTDFNNY
jgi:hypothetical protein